MINLASIFSFIFSVNLFAADFAITIDDPNIYKGPVFTPYEKDLRILNQLKKYNIKAALFVCGKRINFRDGQELLTRWDESGHMIGNHSYSHLYYNNPKLTYKEYVADILKVEILIKQFDNFQKRFRFPFLKSGESIEKRNKVRSFLESHGYKYGYVTIDASDWYISDRLQKRLKQNPKANIENFKKYYLDHIWDRAMYYDTLAKTVLGRSPKHTLLIHHNLLNAFFLEDLIKHFISKGWNLIDASEAFDDPLFLEAPNNIPSGESIIWALAKEKGIKGLRYPAEDSRYEKDKMDRLGL